MGKTAINQFRTQRNVTLGKRGKIRDKPIRNHAEFKRYQYIKGARWVSAEEFVNHQIAAVVWSNVIDLEKKDL